MNMKKTNIIVQFFVAVTFCVLAACGDPQSPGLEYMPDMYRSPSVEAYVDYSHPDSMMVRTPPAGTVPYSKNAALAYNNMPYAYKNTPEDYEAAGANLKNPIPLTPQVLDEGKGLYDKFCTHCHGPQGKGDGTMVLNDKFPPPPSYPDKLADLPAGKMFHSISYGKGLMGPHAPMLTKEERWKIVHYVQTLQKPNAVAPGATDTTAAAGSAAAPNDTLHANLKK